MASTQEDSFREIQLSGKALVFLFMAVTVIAVGIFLMGLLVGRGVLATRGPAGADSAAAREAEPPPPPATTTASSSSPSTAGEKLSYAERLGSSEPAKEQLKAAPAPPETPPTPRGDSAPAPRAAAKTAAATKNTPPAAPAAPAAASSEPAGPGFAIQVAAIRERDEAETMVKRLVGKGYPAYVVVPRPGEPSQIYRVRVGKFQDRREADTVAARLQKEEQFKPWIVR
jgi:cell division septation protein DedD